jgi:hypothetical protein
MFNANLLTNGNIADLISELTNINLSNQLDEMLDQEYRQYLSKDAGIEHYKLLAYISSCYTGQPIYDIGTHKGNSSLAMSYSSNTKIISYDIVDVRTIRNLPKNVEYRLGDFRLDPQVLQSPFIFVDVDPHDGIQEKAFHEFFLANNYKGLVMWDDIKILGTKPWWDSINEKSIIKLDLSQAGHWSGTGLIIYN